MIRLIPRLDIKGPNLVKGIHLEGLRVLGHPADYARRYYADGADELMLVDTVASLYGRAPDLSVIEHVAADVFIPICVGGGIRTIEHIRQALRAGADKVLINTAAVQRPEFISEAAEMFGRSTIVVAIEVVKQNGGWRVVTDCGRERTGLEAVSWARRVAELGAGEIVVTSVDNEGTGRGFALTLVRAVHDAVSVPVTAHGGCGHAEDLTLVAPFCEAVALASVLHYRVARDVSAEGLSGNVEYLRRSRDGVRGIGDCSVGDLRAMMRRRAA